MFMACSKKMQAIEKSQIIPPIHLTQIEKIPKFEGNTNGELLNFTIVLRGIIEKQNINLEAIQLWFKTL